MKMDLNISVSCSSNCCKIGNVSMETNFELFSTFLTHLNAIGARFYLKENDMQIYVNDMPDFKYVSNCIKCL